MRASYRIAMLIAIAFVFARNDIIAQSPAAPTVISQLWLRTQILEADVHDTGKHGWPETWKSIRERPEDVPALIAIHNDSTVPRIERYSALSFLGATGQLSAYNYLARMFDNASTDLDTRVSVIYGFGSFPHSDIPPESIFQRLVTALASGPERQRIAAAYALGDLHSSRADSVLRRRRAVERSPAVLQRIDRNLARASTH